MSHANETDLSMMSPGMAEDVAETLRVLSTPSRLRILSALSDGPASADDIAARAGLSASATDEHLGALESANLLVAVDGAFALHNDHLQGVLEQTFAHTEHVRQGLTDPVQAR